MKIEINFSHFYIDSENINLTGGLKRIQKLRFSPGWIYNCSLFILFFLISFSSLSGACVPPKTGPSANYLQALLRFEPWAESTWKDYPKILNSGYFGDGASDGDAGIRGTIGVAFSNYVLIRAFPDAQHLLR
jgi:hypothetical protein